MARRPGQGGLTFSQLATLLVFLAIGLSACLMPAQSDTWWHLREGELLWHRGAEPLRDYFSHTVFGQHWPNREWLSQVLFYGLYRAGGLPLLTAFLASLIVGAWWCSWRLIPARTSRLLMVMALAVTSSSIQWSLRPQVFTFFFMGFTAFLIVHRRFLLLPLVFLVWANLHGGVLLGCVLLGVAVMRSFIEAGRPDALRMTASAVVSFLLTGVTPNGSSLWTTTLDAVHKNRVHGVSEFGPPSVTDLTLLPFWLIATALLVLTVAARPWRQASIARHFVVAGAVVLLPLAITISRNVPAILLLAVPAVVLLSQSVVPERPPAPRRERPLGNVIVLTASFLLAVGFVAHAWSAPSSRLQWHPLPDGAAEAITSCRPNLYNRFDEGGYIIWFAPTQKVFIDGRFDPYPAELLNEHVRVETTGDYAPVFRRFEIHCAFLPSESILARKLRADGWRVRYDRDPWVVFEQ